MRQKIKYENMSAKEYLTIRGRIAGSTITKKKSDASAANGRKYKGVKRPRKAKA